MRCLFLSLFLLSSVSSALANPFEEKPQAAGPDYDKEPNDLPIGVSLQVLDADTLSAFGVQGQSVGLAVTEIGDFVRNFQLDIQTGDVITHLNGEPVKGMSHYKSVVDRSEPNKKVVIRLFRNGANKDIELFRVHAFGLKRNYHKSNDSWRYSSIFNSEIESCYIIKYNNIDYGRFDLLDMHKNHSFGVFMFSCNNAVMFKKIEKKKKFGIWSQFMLIDFSDQHFDRFI